MTDAAERFPGFLLQNCLARWEFVPVALTWYYKKERFVISRRGWLWYTFMTVERQAMSELGPMNDEAVARSVMYLAGAVLLIAVFAVVGLLLNAELGEQAKLKAQAEQSVVVQTTSPLTSTGWFWRRHNG